MRALLASAGLVGLLAVVVATPTRASAADGQPSEDTLRAGQVQVQADEAWRAGVLDEALRLANRAVSLDPGATTWLAQQIRIEVLERWGSWEEAMTHLEDYLALDGLFPEHRAWGEEARQRIGTALAGRQEREAGAAGAARRRGLGAGMLIGGALPVGLGTGFVIQFGHNDGDVDQYGGWLDSGLVLLAVGVGVEVSGAILVASGGPGVATGTARVAATPTPTVGIAPFLAGPDGTPGGLLLVGRF